MQSPSFPSYHGPPRSKYSPQHHVLKHRRLPSLPQCQPTYLSVGFQSGFLPACHFTKPTYAFLLLHVYATCAMKDEIIHFSKVQYVRVKERVESKYKLRMPVREVNLCSPVCPFSREPNSRNM